MASHQSIAAVGSSLERFLTMWFTRGQPIDGQTTSAVLVRTEDFEGANGNESVIAPPALSILIYRIDCDRTVRAGWSGVGACEGRARLPLEIRFLITPWANNAQNELSILGAAMHGLDAQPILTGPLLMAIDGVDWAAGEAVQITLDSITTDTVMETFDSLPIDYKLSVPYVARVVRIDARAAHAAVPVTTAAVGTIPEVPEEER